MKKLMIAAVVALVGVAANAAVFAWDINGSLVDHDGSMLDETYGAGGYYVYLMVGSGTDAGAGNLTTYSYENAIQSVSDGSVAFLSKAMGDGGAVSPFFGTASGTSIDALAKQSGQTPEAFTAYLVITDADADHLANATYAWVSEELSGAIDSYGNASPSPISFGTDGMQNGWVKLEAVPEPTSGLLLLLGVAGLALRRRRA